MRILVTGSQGYVGSAFIECVANNNLGYVIDGFDIGYFHHLNHFSVYTSDFRLSSLKLKDLRDITERDLKNYDAIVHLAAISNDPIGNNFSEVTKDINFLTTIDLAKKAKKMKVKKFIFASSASVYGFSKKICTENSHVNPLTAYAQSKVSSEVALREIADKDFQVTCLRFSTAAGWSPRLRTDIAFNNFVVTALTQKKIILNSNGLAYRPFVGVKDMSRAISFCLSDFRDEFQDYEIYNVGQNSWNFKIVNLAEKVLEILPEAKLKILDSSDYDARSYKLNFDKYASAAESFQMQESVEKTIDVLIENINIILKSSSNDYFDAVIRLRALNTAIDKKLIDSKLRLSSL